MLYARGESDGRNVTYTFEGSGAKFSARQTNQKQLTVDARINNIHEVRLVSKH